MDALATESEQKKDTTTYTGEEGSTLTGTFRMHHQLKSRFLEPERDVIVLLPPGYDTAVDQRYPVFYMHDGQNLFDAKTAFGGREWHVDETVQGMIEKGEIEPMIIVGIYNTGGDRIDEYTPSVDRKHQHGGKAPSYLRFITDDLKPFIDFTYRTLPDRDHTAVGGSSLGGLVSLFMALERPDIFSKVAVISPSLWWDRRMILRRVRKLTSKLPLKIWLDSGSNEGRTALQNVRDFRALLLGRGWIQGSDLGYLEAHDHGHDEGAWAARMGAVLGFLFGKSNA
jgi:predicted alpha/beta superfamily hydrolase